MKYEKANDFSCHFRFLKIKKVQMKSLLSDDYEIEILFGEIAAIVAIVYGFHLFWKMLFKHALISSIAFAFFYVLVPFLFLFFLNRHNLKYVKLFFWVWEICIVLTCLSGCADVLDHFHLFWKLILPAVFVTICMMVGVNGMIRIEKPDKLLLPKDLKIPETQINLLRLMETLTYLIALTLWFIFMVLLGKYFHDLVLLNWPSFHKHRLMVFYIGMAIGFYPAKILGAAISVVFTALVNLIYGHYAKF